MKFYYSVEKNNKIGISGLYYGSNSDFDSIDIPKSIAMSVYNNAYDNVDNNVCNENRKGCFNLRIYNQDRYLLHKFLIEYNMSKSFASPTFIITEIKENIR